MPAALVAGIALSALPAAVAQAAETYPAPASGAWTVTGHGFGHGWGMSQWGAQSRAVAGQGHRQILEAYYPGTRAATRPDRTVRVQLSRFAGPEVFLESRTAAPLRVGAREVPQGQRLRVTWDGGALVLTAFLPGWQEVWSERVTAAPTVTGADGVWVERLDGSGNRYAGTVTFPLAAPVTPVNVIGLEGYLLGVVPRESPAWFAPEALKAQAVAARSYALSTLRPASSGYDICDTEACQVYQGAATRTAAGAVTDLQPAATTAAVRATAGEIREFEGAAAFTQFSSSNGGWSATGSKPYLRAAPDPFSSPAGKVPQDTVAGWTAQLPVAAVARSCPAGGQPRSLSITRRDGNGEWGGRITDLVVRCTTGEATLSGSAVARFAGTLRSSWWAVVPGGTAEVDAAWRRVGGPGGVLGLPTSPVWALPQVEGSYQLFQRGSVYWSPATGAHEVHGAIRERWGALGWENGYLGFPATDETALRGGAFNHFQGGSVYWSPATGARAVRGAIRDAWARQGWEAGRLGYPTSDEYDVPGGKRSDFQGGSITWTPAGGAVVALR
ncbi:SpoIID/LytB domain-containing protein [Kineococcus gypseus]|uniref:SpoIID/LytB domain-containing protein n=1 Tax=Kineococcus gypseus TaxID=1637102 RepID=UPI003D7DB8D1